jgi:predicted helicase
LARHAREARRRLGRHSIDDIRPLQEAFEQSLGLTFEEEKGQRFFRSSLVQTLFYGLFSGWMLWKQTIPKGRKPGEFDWKEASEYLALPLLADLFEEVAKPKRLRELDLREPLDWATASLNRVNHEAFFKTFDRDHAITLFYEPFLEAFDPELRKELGVWYTPPEIVKYMVGRVDQLLRSELNIADGLADERVYVLDPAAGTGSYLLEVARKIHETLDEQGHGALAAAKVKKAMCERVFGFEILTAPYVVAHLQLGVILREMGAKLAAKDRVGVYLTNALTGWEPPRGVKATSAFQFLQDEQDAAAKVKREAPIIVILGNPPYNGYAGVALAEEGDLIRPYKEGLHKRFGIKKQTLDDLYIRFFRLAERRIGDVGKRGVVCYISNYSWLNGIPHVIMRERLLSTFDTIFVDNLHGDRKAKERSPDGTASATVFAMRGSSPGIKVGTAITTLVKASGTTRRTDGGRTARVEFRDFADGEAVKRRERLLRSLTNRKEGSPRAAAPTAAGRWSLLPTRRTGDWAKWPSLLDLFGETFKGVQPGRGRALVSIDREPLQRRMQAYFEKALKTPDIAEAYPELMADEARYDAAHVRKELLAKGHRFQPECLVPTAWFPFDIRYLYWQPFGKLLNEKRPEYKAQVWQGNLFLACTQKPRHEVFPIPVVVEHIGSYYFFDPYATYFPLRRKHESLNGDAIQPGVQAKWLALICEVMGVKPFERDGHSWTDKALIVNDDIFFHVVASLCAPAYAVAHADALRVDWPRTPLPMERAMLRKSAAIGRRLADLMMPSRQVESVTKGKLVPELRSLALPFKADGKPIDPDKDLFVNGGWASVDKDGRVSTREGRVTPNADDPKGAVDIWINDRVGWKNIPSIVWNFTLGGYPVINKWLSYREQQVLGRALRLEEMTYITEVVRRLKAILLMGPELDENCRACAKETISLKKG